MMVRGWLVCAVLAFVGVAPAALAEPPPLEAYGRAPAISELSLSQTGKYAAFLVSTAQGRKIAIEEVGGKLIATIDPGPAKLRDVSWAGDDFLLVTTSSTVNLGMYWGFKHEIGNVVAFDRRTLKLLTIFEKTAKIPPAVFGTHGVANIGGRWYGYFGGLHLEGDIGDTYLSNGHPLLYRVDLETGHPDLAAPPIDHAESWVVNPAGEVIAHAEYDQKTSDWKAVVGPGSGGKVLLERNSPLNELSLVGQGRTPGTVLVEDSTGESDALLEISLADGKTETLLGDYTLDDLAFDHVSGLLLGAGVKQPVAAVFFDPVRQARVRGAFKAFPQNRANLVSYSPDFASLIVMTDGGDDPGSYWFVDIPKGSALPIGSTRPDVPASEVGPTRMFAYKAADGLALEGVLTLPPHGPARNLPLVVMPHGGPIGISDEVGFDWWAQAFASRGYAVFQPNFRGSGGYTKALRQAGYGEWGRKMVTDVSDGMAALAAAGIVDPKRACIVGASYGGYSALAGVTLQNGLYRCAVSYAGVSDLPTFRHWELDRRDAGDNDMARYWRTVIKSGAKDAPGLGEISPARLAGRADAPILLIHGKDDTVVPIDQSREMKNALDGAGKGAVLIELPGQDHWLTDEASRIQMLKASVAFVQANNPPN